MIKREKRACRSCRGRYGDHAAFGQPRIVEKGLASDRVVVETVVAKVLRSSAAVPARPRSWSRMQEVEIGRATLDGWVMRVGEMLQPVVAAMRQDLLRASCLQADETIVPVQMHDKRGADRQAPLMAIRQAGRRNGIRIPHGPRGREGPQKFLGQWEGILPNRWVPKPTMASAGPKLVHVGCWARPA